MKLLYNKQNEWIDAPGRKIPCTNLVRNEVNGLRKPTQIVRTINKDGGPGVAYMPRDFPLGDWHITSISAKTDPFLAPFFIATDAWQFVDEWETKDGKYTRIMGRVPDYGYGIHFSISPTTLGCIRILNRDDLLTLCDEIKAAWANKESVSFIVSSMKP